MGDTDSKSTDTKNTEALTEIDTRGKKPNVYANDIIRLFCGTVQLLSPSEGVQCDGGG